MFPVYIDQPKHLKVFLVVKWRLKNSGREHRIKISLVHTINVSVEGERGGEEGKINIQTSLTISGDEYRILTNSMHGEKEKR